MPAPLQKFSDHRKINPNGEPLIQCRFCPQKYLLVWNDKEWNSVKDWFESWKPPFVEATEYREILNFRSDSKLCQSREFRAGLRRMPL